MLFPVCFSNLIAVFLHVHYLLELMVMVLGFFPPLLDTTSDFLKYIISLQIVSLTLLFSHVAIFS